MQWHPSHASPRAARAVARPTPMQLLVLAAAAALLAALFFPVPAGGQAPDSIARGDWVLLKRPGAKEDVQGRVSAIDARSVTLLRQGGRSTLIVPRAELTEAFVSTGQHRHGGRGALLGFAGLGTAGAVLSLATFTGHDCGFLCTSPGEAGVLGFLSFGAAGAVFGGLIGTAVRGDDWVQVRATAALRVGPAPDGGVRLGVSLPR